MRHPTGQTDRRPLRALGLLGLSVALALALASAGCRERATRGRIVVSVIGLPLAGTLHSPSRGTEGAELALREATGLGLLRLDEAGQILPGVAVRWAMIDEGPDGIFRIDIANGLSTRLVAARLRTALAMAGGAWLEQGIDAIVPVTPTVIDVRLAAPRTDLTTILALPALATLDPAGGPMRIAERREGGVLLEGKGAGGDAKPAAVMLRGERVGRAVARFAAGESRLVLGGSFADLPVARAARLPRGALRFDHPAGLFGFVPVDAASIYARHALIEALSLAIDRDRIVALIDAPGAAKATTIAGSRYEPAFGERLSRARALIAAAAPAPRLRVAMPQGPGAAALFRLVAQDWARLGIVVDAVRAGQSADLALVDLVVPAGERARAACTLATGCDARDPRALLDPPYIPISTPVRWSLVAPDLDLFTENMLAVHPLDRLRSAR